MQFTVSSSALLKQLQTVSGAIGNNATLPILSDFLFRVENSVLTISATDLETSMVAELVVNADSDGAVAVPSKILLEVLKALPEQPLLFRVDTNTFAIELQTLNGKYKLSGEDGDDFPRIPEASTESSVSLSALTLSTAINRTLFAVSTDELRPAMTGVLFVLESNGVTFVATDAHRLVKYTVNGLDLNNETTQFIVPRKALNLLKTTLPTSDIEVSLSFDRLNAYFSFNEIRLVCRLIDARFPDYGSVIPNNNDNLLTLNRAGFQNSVRRISIFSNKTTHQIVLRIKGTQLTLNAQDLDYANEASEIMDCEFEGEDMDIAFNGRFLSDIMANLSTEDVQLSMSTPNRAVLVKPTESSENEEIVMLVMPIMLNNY